MSLIVKIGADARAFEKEMKKLTKDVQLVSDRLNSVGQTLTRNVTLPILAVGAAATKVGMDFEASMSKLSVAAGASGKDVEALENKAMEMGANTKYSATEAADAMTELAKAGMNTKQTVDAIGGVLAMAAIENMNLADAAAITSSVLNGFKLEASDSGRVADVLAKTSGATAAGVADMGEAMKYVSGTASTMGLSLEETSAAIGIMSNAGIKGSEAGSQLRMMLVRLASPSKEASKMMEQMGFNAFDANGKMLPLNQIIGNLTASTSKMTDEQKLNALATIFGTESVAGMNAILGEGQDGLKKFTEELQNSTGYAQETADAINNNLKGSLDELSSALENAGIKLYKNFSVGLKGIVDSITNLVNKFSNLSPKAQKTILILAGIAAAVGPTLIVLSKLILAFSKLKIMFGALGAAKGVGGVLTALASGPIGLIIAAIVALIAVIALIVIYWDDIKEAAIKAWNAIISFLQPVIDWLKNAFITTWETIKSVWATVSEFFIGIWNSIYATLQPLIAEITGTFQMIWEVIKLIWGYAEPFFAAIWAGIKAVFSVVAIILGAFFKNAWEIIKAVWSVVGDYFKAIWETIKIVFSFVADVLGGYFKVAWVAIKAVWSVVVAFFTLVWAGIKAVFAVVKGILSGDFSDAWDAIKNVWNKAKAFFDTVWNGIKAVFAATEKWFGDIFKGAWNAVKNVFATWGSFFSGLWNTIKNTFVNIGTNIANAISGAVKKGINGVISMIENTINGAIGLINGAIKLINKIPGVNIGFIGKLNLPKLATGGKLLNNGAAIVGEAGAELVQKSGSQVKVTPLSSQEKAAGIGGALGAGGFSGTIIVPVTIDGRVVAKVTAPYMDGELKNISKNKKRGGK